MARCAQALRDGPRRTRDPAPVVPDATRTLLRNAHGWFERVERGGTRRLTPVGEPGDRGGVTTMTASRPRRA
ncbi:MAG TPA: hypothetical protein VEX11_00645 [Acetobacteraceae bacterium]|nr:hypothetical protein [Acetobacteraceae bacterium]